MVIKTRMQGNKPIFLELKIMLGSNFSGLILSKKNDNHFLNIQGVHGFHFMRMSMVRFQNSKHILMYVYLDIFKM